MDGAYKYNAFISYRHITPDKPIAIRLQELLESYTPPKSIRGAEAKKLKLFRDETELPTSSDLGNDIKEALRGSEYLIVVCSGKTEESRWCMEEIEYFKSLHGGSNKNILTLLVSETGEVCFPEALRYETVYLYNELGEQVATRHEIEPLAANVSAPDLKGALKKLKTEYLRLAAPLLGYGYDELYNREQRRKNKRRLTVFAAAAIALSVIAAASIVALVTIANQKAQIENDAMELRISSSNYLIKESSELEESGKLYDALTTALDAVPKNGEYPLSNAAVLRLSQLSGLYRERYFTCDKALKHNSPVKGMTMLGDGSRVASIDDVAMYLWNTENGELVKKYTGDFSDVFSYECNKVNYAALEYYAAGSYSGEDLGEIFALTNVAQKTLGLTETREYENALYIVNNAEGKESINRINPEDGSYLWTYDTQSQKTYYTGLSTNSLSYIESGVLIMIDAEDGSIGASINADEFKKLDGKTVENIDHYGNRIIVTAKSGGATYLCVFNKGAQGYEFAFSSKISDKGLFNPASAYRGDVVYISGSRNEESFRVTPLLEAYSLTDGKRLWSHEGSLITGGYTYMGIMDSRSQNGSMPLVFSFIGNRMMLCDADTGKLLDEFSLTNGVTGMYYSENGYIFVTDSEGRELVFLMTVGSEEEEKLVIKINDFRTENNLTKYMSNAYAALKQGSDTIMIYHTIESDDVTEVYKRPDEDYTKSLSDFILSPDKKRAIITQYEPYVIHVTQAEQNKDKAASVPAPRKAEETATITLDDQTTFLCRFLSSDVLAVIQYNSITLYDLNTGLKLQSLSSGEYDVSKYHISEEDHTLSLVDKNGSLVLTDGKSEPETLIAAKDENEHEIKTRMHFGSGDHQKFVVKTEDRYFHVNSREKDDDGGYSMDFDSETSTKWQIYDREEKSFVELQADGLDLDYIRSFIWLDDNKKLYLLVNEKIILFDTATGERLYEGAYENRIMDVIDIEGSVCILDGTGNLIKADLSQPQITAQKTVKLGLDYPIRLGYLSFEKLHGSKGALRYGSRGWIMDTDKFEIFCEIDNLSGIDEENNAVYILYYNKILEGPMMTAENIIKKAESIIN